MSLNLLILRNSIVMTDPISYNKVDLLPISGNLIGIDKLVVEIPDNGLIDKRDIENISMWVDGETGDVRSSKGNVLSGVDVKMFYDCIRFTLNPAVELYGNNFYTASFQHLKIVIERLEKELKIDLGDAVVRRLDLQSTMAVKHNPVLYFSVLGNYKGFIRQQIGGSTLYYTSKGTKKYKTLMFYDKKKQSKNHSKLKEFEHGNYLRLEIQYFNTYIKKIGKKLGENITLKNLFRDKINKQFVDEWIKDYLYIFKETKRVLDMSLVNKPSDLDIMLINMGIDSVGGLTILEGMVENSKPFSNRGSDFFSKIKKRYRDKSTSEKFTLINPYIEELDSLIKLSYNNAINLV